MRPVLRLLVITGALGLFASGGRAHYNMLLPETASAKRKQAVAILYQWGHPFEHQLFDAPAPESVVVVGPDGKKADLTRELEKVPVAGTDGKKAGAYRFRFTPPRRGDYQLVLRTPPIWMADEKVYLQDTVKVVLHVQDQDGWDAATGQDFELVPLTRPYGLRAGMVFQGQVFAGGKPTAGALVEVERYNPTPPRELPADEHITRTAKTDPNGVVTTSLTEPGWWCLTALREAGKRAHQGKDYPLRKRTTLWVYVDDKVGPRK